MEVLNKNEAWDLVEFIVERKLVVSKWVFKNKLNIEGKKEKWNNFLVRKGYS
jgi:hypothetical protein